MIIFFEKKINNRQGFTLIEILVVVSIIAVLTVGVIAGLGYFQAQTTLETTAQEVLTVLRLAQNKTLASEGASNYGVYFEAGRFTLFKGTVYNPASPDNQRHDLSSSLRFSEINLAGSLVYFERLTGAVQNGGSVRLASVNDAARYKVIFIDTSGTVSLVSSAPADAGRIADSRHEHVAYAQNVKNASFLTLFFPASGATENIDFQAHLNPGKIEFFWEGTILVGGEEQVLNIHTHSLTDSSAVFCFHRDRRHNTAAVNISLDGQNLINYASDGAVIQGTSIWAGAPQNQ